MVVLGAMSNFNGVISVQFSETDLGSQSVGGQSSAGFQLSVEAAPYGARAVHLSVSHDSVALFEQMFQCPKSTSNHEVESHNFLFGSGRYDLVLQWDGANGIICGSWTNSSSAAKST